MSEEYFRQLDLGPRWLGIVDLWLELEDCLHYPDGQVSCFHLLISGLTLLQSRRRPCRHRRRPCRHRRRPCRHRRRPCRHHPRPHCHRPRPRCPRRARPRRRRCRRRRHSPCRRRGPVGGSESQTRNGEVSHGHAKPTTTYLWAERWKHHLSAPSRHSSSSSSRLVAS